MIRGRGIDRHEPDAPDAQILEVIQFFRDAVEIADAVSVAVAERTDEDFIEYGVIPPGKSLGAGRGDGCLGWLENLSWSWCAGDTARTGLYQNEQETDFDKRLHFVIIPSEMMIALSRPQGYP